MQMLSALVAGGKRAQIGHTRRWCGLIWRCALMGECNAGEEALSTTKQSPWAHQNQQ